VSDWSDFAVVIGAATASLLGLLFVAVSFHGERIAASTELRNRAAQTLSLLLTGLLVAALLVVPGQHLWTLGVEYLVLALVVARLAFVLDRRAGNTSSSAIAHRLDSTNPTLVTCSLLVVAAVVLVLGHADGIYVLVPALIAVLVGGVMNAWLILVRLPA
jgi:hypothetical protein